jgi:hypothetical protein
MQLSPAIIVVGEQSWQELMSPASTNAQNWYLMSPASIVPLQNQQSLFKAVKHCQIKSCKLQSSILL